MPKVRYKKDDMSPEQVAMAKKYMMVEDMAIQAGFDDDAFAHTEFCLMAFFNLVVERCAVIADSQAQCYTGEHNESAGCHGAAAAIRYFGSGLVPAEKNYVVK